MMKVIKNYYKRLDHSRLSEVWGLLMRIYVSKLFSVVVVRNPFLSCGPCKEVNNSSHMCCFPTCLYYGYISTYRLVR